MANFPTTVVLSVRDSHRPARRARRAGKTRDRSLARRSVKKTLSQLNGLQVAKTSDPTPCPGQKQDAEAATPSSRRARPVRPQSGTRGYFLSQKPAGFVLGPRKRPRKAPLKAMRQVPDVTTQLKTESVLPSIWSTQFLMARYSLGKEFLPVCAHIFHCARALCVSTIWS